MRPFDHDVGADLAACLTPEPGDTLAAEVARTILSLADAAAALAAVMARGPLAGALGAETGGANTDGDQQKHLDVMANELVLEALRASGAAYYASEEEDAILTLDPAGALAVAVDPLDGSSNIDVNVSVGTIFSIFAASPLGATASFFRPGHEQLAAGYFIYGPHTALVVTTGHGTHMFALDPASRRFQLVRVNLAIPLEAREFAINASNYRHWFPPVRAFIDDCLVGAEGPRGKDFNMRWVGSLVAEAHRIFTRGGVFLYPGDRRTHYGQGRLRLIYEVFPMALLAEQAGGGASDGSVRILDKVPGDLHERAPLVFGSSRKVAIVAGYHAETTDRSEAASPLFGRRGLFRS